MSEPYLGEIRIVAFNYPPHGWAFCDGQTLPISQNQALFAILGTTYGGDGVTTFRLPDFRGRIPAHVGNSLILGEVGGEATHTLNVNEIPAHGHSAAAATATASTGDPTNAAWAATSTAFYGPSPDSVMSPSAIGTAGLSQPHENRAPYQVLNFAIALAGIFPSRP